MVNSASTKKIVLFIVLLTICIFITDYFFPLGVAVGLPYVAVVLLSLWLAKKEYTLFLGIIVTVLTILGFFISPPKVDLWIVITNRTSALFGVWACVYFVIKYKEILKAHLKEKEKSELYLDIAPSIFLVLDKHHIVQKINRKGCELLDLPKEEIQGKDWFKNFVPPEKQQQISNAYTKNIKEKIHHDNYFEYEVLTKNGEKRLIGWTNEVLFDDDGNIANTLSAGKNITKQKQAEIKLITLNKELEQKVKERTQVLEESQRMYSMIAHNFPNGEIDVFDKDLNYVFVEGMELYKKGITGDMLIGTSFLERIDPEIRDDLERKILSVFKGNNISFELETEEKTYLINAVGIKGVDNEINQILMVSQNITSLKNAEKNIQKALVKEQRLNEFKTRFVSMTSHEFRTPLTGIMNAASLLSKYIGTEGTEEKQQKHINRIKGAVVSLTTILNDFLSMDKLEEGKIVLQNSEFNFTEFCNKKLGFVANMTKIGQQIEYHHKGSTIINTDSKMLGLIMNNLLSNAIKYSPENSTIKCDTVVENKVLTITVSDKGIGIPKDEQNQLFSLFFRAKNAHNIQGTGLGLNIVKKYLDVAGGEISCESDSNKGSAFTIKIPLTN